MDEIRLRWVASVRPGVGGLWCLDTPANRQELLATVKAACEAYGPGTHWLESRSLLSIASDPASDT